MNRDDVDIETQLDKLKLFNFRLDMIFRNDLETLDRLIDKFWEDLKIIREPLVEARTGRTGKKGKPGKTQQQLEEILSPEEIKAREDAAIKAQQELLEMIDNEPAKKPGTKKKKKGGNKIQGG